jgi:phosphoenolpyruvate carboxykinase (ATP)
MLTADAFGVLPPIARLTPSQAMYHFLSGFTAKVAGTEKGLGKEPQPTFSTCFGAPFMPRHPSEYGNLLRDLIAEHKVDCWLVNTGWTGGAFGTGSRMPIKVTRALLSAALDGTLKTVEMRKDPHFGFDVPVAVPGVDSKILNPRETWADKAAYDKQAIKLVQNVPRQLQEVRSPCRRGREGRGTQARRSRGVTGEGRGSRNTGCGGIVSRRRSRGSPASRRLVTRARHG